MPCHGCKELARRLAELEAFVSAAEAKLSRVRLGHRGAMGWPSDWPQPNEATASRASAFRRGVMDYREGRMKDSCPYGAGSRGHDNAWRRGWISAKRAWGKPAAVAANA